MILVIDYDQAWPQRFETLRDEYAAALAAAGAAVLAIEHVGSTSVPGLAVKPVIDCDIVAGSLSLRNHLAVRDILRAYPGLRDRYAAVKQQTGATAADIDEYGRGKNAIIQQILAAAGLTDAERAAINGSQVPSHTELPR